uniref:Uncharacterized protein n=1 Tax=Tetranychus urticae TaxID=32264 RepID=T1KAG3_TETUR
MINATNYDGFHAINGYNQNPPTFNYMILIV